MALKKILGVGLVLGLIIFLMLYFSEVKFDICQSTGIDPTFNCTLEEFFRGATLVVD